MDTHSFTVGGVQLQSRVDDAKKVVWIKADCELTVKEAGDLLRLLGAAIACAGRDTVRRPT